MLLVFISIQHTFLFDWGSWESTVYSFQLVRSQRQTDRNINTISHRCYPINILTFKHGGILKIFYIQTIYISVDHCPPKQMRMEMGESCCTGHFKFLASELTLLCLPQSIIGMQLYVLTPCPPLSVWKKHIIHWHILHGPRPGCPRHDVFKVVQALHSQHKNRGDEYDFLLLHFIFSECLNQTRGKNSSSSWVNNSVKHGLGWQIIVGFLPQQNGLCPSSEHLILLSCCF